MNRDNVFDMFDGVRSKYIVDAIESRKAILLKRTHTKNIFLIAAAIAMAALLVGCGIVYVLKMQDLKLGDQQVTQERWDEESKTVVMESVSQQVLTLSGVKGSPNYLAAKEWFEFKQTYDPGYTILSSVWGSEPEFPAVYDFYGLYSQEMVDKLNEITQKYSLNLMGARVTGKTGKNLFEYLGTKNFLLPDAPAITDEYSGAYYEGGYCYADMKIRMEESEGAWPYHTLLSYYYSPKDCFDDTIIALEDNGDWTERNYTTSGGTNLLILRSPTSWLSWVFCDRGNATITLRMETVLEGYGDDGVDRITMTDEQMNQILDVINFNLEPDPGDPAILEGQKASNNLIQTSNGYTVEVKEVITDGHITKITLGLTAPEGINLEQYNDRHGNGGLRFGSFSYAPKEPIHSSGGSRSGLNLLEDGDGKVNTVDFTVELYEYVENGMAYENGSVWYLYLDGLEVEKRDLELHQSEMIWEQAGTWSFEITMDNGDWREIEFVSDPITTSVCTGWDINGNDVYKSVVITSIKLWSFGADYTAPDAAGQLDFANYKQEQYPTVILKDGTEIKLRGDLRLLDSDADMIPMEEVDHLLLIDGTKLYPQG